MRSCRVLIALCCVTIIFNDSYVQAQPPGRSGGRGEQGRGPQGRGAGGRPGQGPQAQGQRTQGGLAGQSIPPWIRLFDSDSDGELSASEIDNAASLLLKLDRNGDGILSGDELRPAGRSGPNGRREGGQANSRGGPVMRGQPGQRGGSNRSGGNEGRGPGGGGGRNGGRGGDPAQADAAFAAEIMSLDANQDGLIAVKELPDHMHEAFEVADADKNGTLNEDELLTLASQFRRKELNPNEGQEIKNAPTQGRRGPN